MKKIIFAVLATTLFVSCQQEKIAFVDNSKLLDEYQEKVDLENSLKQKVQLFQGKRDSIMIAFQKEAQTFDEESKKMSKDAAQKKYNELIQKSNILQQQLQNEQQNLQLDSQTQMDYLLGRVKKFVKQYWKDNGYTFILGANDGGSVLYGSENKDITEEIVKALNEAYRK